MIKRIVAVFAALTLMFGFAACSSDSDVASKNISKDADNYKVFREVVVYNTFTDKYILDVKGFCALGNNDAAGTVSYTCKTNEGYIKDIIKKSDNVIVYAHQLDPSHVSTKYYKVILKPSEIVPEFEIR
jgi:hypothetical protein